MKKIHRGIVYQVSSDRRHDLETAGSHIIKIDLKGSTTLRLIIVYRCFKTTGNIDLREIYRNQLRKIKKLLFKQLLLGNSNLDWSKKSSNKYPFKAYFEDMNEMLSDLTLCLLVNFPTWSRLINGVHKKSVIDQLP
jgi:hypothetical protein